MRQGRNLWAARGEQFKMEEEDEFMVKVMGDAFESPKMAHRILQKPHHLTP
jgi:hypothetical protein